MNCRFCGHPATEFLDLHHQPPSNAFLTAAQLDEPETYYPLKVYVCEKCWLVQVPAVTDAAEIFGADYPYYSSQSPSNISHAKELAGILSDRLGLAHANVLEIGSNDGYLLRWFKDRDFTVLGVDPAEGPTQEARCNGINTITGFFSKDLATSPAIEGSFDLICGLNVIAHQPDINDFVEGVKIALRPGGVAVFEFPHLMNLINGNQFDTIYHEHYSYFSFITISRIFAQHRLEIFDVDEIPEHGGSLRIYAQHTPDFPLPYYPGKAFARGQFPTPRVAELINRELSAGLQALAYYSSFNVRVEKIRRDLLLGLHHTTMNGMHVGAYGAAAKGNTLLNYCGVRPDMIDYVVDRSPHKQGKYLPGSHIPVFNEEFLKADRPDIVLILPWNLREEIMNQLSYIKEWGGQFMVAIPKVEVFSWTKR